MTISRLIKWGRGGPPVFYASLVVGILSGAFGVYTYLLPVWQPAVSLASALLMGFLSTVLAFTAAFTCRSSLNKGKWGWVSVVVGAACLLLVMAPPLFIGAFHWIAPLAILTIATAVLNVRESGRAATCLEPRGAVTGGGIALINKPGKRRRGGPTLLQTLGLMVLGGFIGFGLLYAFVSVVLPFVFR